jgi:hypothetical protein
MFRFAMSEKDYLLQLRRDVRELVGDHNTVSSCSNSSVPDGFIDSPAILNNLCDAIQMRGRHYGLRVASDTYEAHKWVREAPLIPPLGSRGLQSQILRVLSPPVQQEELGSLLAQKAVVTFGEEWSGSTIVTISWFKSLTAVLDQCKCFLRFCWLRAIAGAWCTTVRMHEETIWPCIFGCTDVRDEFGHYILCPILWQIVSEVLGHSLSIEVDERLCLKNPSIRKLQALACAHVVYHSCKNDSCCKRSDGSIAHQAVVQRRASEFARAARHLVYQNAFVDSSRRIQPHALDSLRSGVLDSGAPPVVSVGLFL